APRRSKTNIKKSGINIYDSEDEKTQRSPTSAVSPSRRNTLRQTIPDSSSEDEVIPRRTRSTISPKAFGKTSTPKSAKDFETKVMSKNLSETLLSHGYLPLDNVILDDNVVYIKAATEQGDIVFIEPDQKGVIVL